MLEFYPVEGAERLISGSSHYTHRFMYDLYTDRRVQIVLGLILLLVVIVWVKDIIKLHCNLHEKSMKKTLLFCDFLSVITAAAVMAYLIWQAYKGLKAF